MISQENIQLARSKNLFELLSQRGYTLLKEGNQYRLSGHAGLIISGTEWYHHSQNRGGNPIDLLMHLENLSFAKSVKTLISNHQEPILAFDNDLSKCENYLTNIRKIDKQLVHDLININFIRQASQSKVCFMGYENQATLNYLGPAKCISWRNFHEQTKGESKGSDKSYSFSIPDFDQKKERRIIIAESPIDIISIACLENIKHKTGYFQTYKIALCGTNHQKIDDRIKKLKPSNISLVLDNDHPGQLATTVIYHKLKNIATTNIIKYPFKDPNEFLINFRQPTSS